MTRFTSDPTVKATWRLIRSWVAQNHKLYYTYVLISKLLYSSSALGAFAVYQFWWFNVVGYYRRRNHHRSLDYAIQKEKEWDLIKPKDEDEEEEETSAGGEAPAQGGEEESE